MSEEKKKSKTLHVDTLHIHANEVIFHQERPEGAGPERGAADPGNGPQIPRDFWGFPVRPLQAPQANEENAAEENAGGENNEGAQQGPPPGWI